MTSDRSSGSSKKNSNVTKRKRSTKVTSTTSNSVFDTVATLEREDEMHLYRRRNRRRRQGDDDDIDDDDEDGILRIQRQKAAVQAQTNIYSRLIECRILLQRSMTSIISETETQRQKPLPQQHQRDEDNMDGNLTRTTDAAIDQCNNILIKLLEARRMLVTPSIENSNNKNANDDDNDDDDNDDDNDGSMDVDDVDYETLVNNSTSESTTNTFDKQLQKEYDGYREQWKEVLNRRHHDVQLHSGVITNHKKFNMIDTSFWNQVQSTIQHQKLRNNTNSNNNMSTNNMSSSNMTIEKSDVSDVSTLSLNHNSNIYYQPFDDTKIYQQMLKDFVETATASNHNSSNSIQTDAALLRKRNKQNQSTSSKKTMVDRKASKGRKIRYTTITKLTNFTFPIQRRHTHSIAMEENHAAMATFLDEDAWFRSLFGGK